MKSTSRNLAVYVLAAAGGFFLHRWGFADRGTPTGPREGTVAPGGKEPPQAKRPSSVMLPDFHFATLTELKAIGAALQKAPDADIVDGISERRGLPKIIAVFLAERIMQMPASARSSALRQARNAGQKDVLEAYATWCDLANAPELLTVLAGTAEEELAVRILFERRAGVPGFKLEEALAGCPRRVRTAACEGVLRGFLKSQNVNGMIVFLEARGAEEWPLLDQIAMPPDIVCTPRMASELYKSRARLPKNLRNYFRGLAASVEAVKYLEQLRRENGIDDGDIFALGNGLEKVTDPAQITAALATLGADKTVKGRAMQWQLFCRLIRAGMAANHPQMDALLSSVPEGRLKDAGINAAALNLVDSPAETVNRFFARGTAEATWVKNEFIKNVAGRNPKLARQIAPSLGSEDRAVLEKNFREANGENL